MKTRILRDVVAAMALLCVFAVVPSGCGSSSSNGASHPSAVPYL